MSERLISEIEALRRYKPEITFKTETMIYFREIEDLIAHVLQSRYKFFSIPAWRYYCREDGRTGRRNMNRLYYKVEVGTKSIWEERERERERVKLVAGDCTDYSGHGRGDTELAEFFIGEVLKLPIEERPLSYLLDEVTYELNKVSKRVSHL